MLAVVMVINDDLNRGQHCEPSSMDLRTSQILALDEYNEDPKMHLYYSYLDLRR